MALTIGQRAAQGFRWTASAHGVRQVLQIVTLIALTRLLDPSDFGLMSMAIVFSGFALLFQDMGIGSALIQRGEIQRVLISTMFWTTTAMGVVLALILYLGAPLVAWFYGEAEVEPLIQFLSLSFVVGGLGVVPKALLQRDLAFARLSQIDVIAAFAGSIMALMAAFSGYGAFSLAVQALIFTVTSTVLLLSSARMRPRFEFSRTALRSVFGYSAGITGFNIANYFIRTADYLILGKFAGVDALGYYTVAYQLMLYPLRHVSNVITRVAFPVYARLQDDLPRLRRAFCRTSASIAMITFPIMTGLAVVADPFVHAVFGAEWSPAIVLIMVLAPVGLAQSLATTFGTIFQVTGRTMLMFAWSVGVGILGIIGFFIGVQWGAEGVAVSYLIVTILLVIPSMMVPFRLIGLPMRTFLSSLWRAGVCAAGMGMVVFAARSMLDDAMAPGIRLSVLIPLGVVTYVALTAALNRRRLDDVLSIAFARNVASAA